MRYMKMNLGVWAFSALALLASCSEKDIVANVAIPEDTAGSHASLYNYTSYGDIYSEYLGEVVCRDAK